MNKAKILVVEDDKPIRNLITTTLKMNDYRFITAVRGNEAIMLSASHKPDIIMLFRSYLTLDCLILTALR